MKWKPVVFVAICILFLASCSRYITPYEAANGKAKCGRMVR